MHGRRLNDEDMYRLNLLAVDKNTPDVLRTSGVLYFVGRRLRGLTWEQISSQKKLTLNPSDRTGKAL
jgi:hypothetical protein